MRIGILIFCAVAIAGCSRISGAPSLPLDASNSGAAAVDSEAFGRYLSLYSFSGHTTGGSPQAGLIAVDGNLYGTTSSYGKGYGTVFAVSPFGKVRVLHAFEGFPDGAYPQAGLLWYKGAFYGTTSAGGIHGGGTVFAVTTSGSEHVVHSFGKSRDGALPTAGLLAVNGVLYGTTSNGGERNKGTVFELTPSGTEHVLHSFAGAPSDGGHPSAGLILVKGALYGTTRAGGKNAAGGTVYKISPFGQVRVLHSFRVAPGDGSNPAGPLVYLNGELYGTTLHGGNIGRGYGTVFAIGTSGAEIVIHSFGSGTDGAYPVAGLVALDGELYGTTTGGGISAKKSDACVITGALRGALGYYKCGTIFKISQFGQEHVLYRFRGYPDGANPEAGLTVANGILYGTTYWGGSSTYYGTIFRIFP